jgi:hypothetical protein
MLRPELPLLLFSPVQGGVYAGELLEQGAASPGMTVAGYVVLMVEGTRYAGMMT